MSVQIKVNKSETVYIALPEFPEIPAAGVVDKTLSLDELCDYEGSRVQLDIDANGRLIGIEVIA